ncbi:MAG TPA: hypothetical protein VFO02_00180 [Burkholderiales bacterium]|nr:hypothetical protein [Burkholderiales bacterium]
MRFLVFMLVAGWTTVATADLYRWIDPESGSVKYSSYPPPWYGDEAREKGAPKVEHIPPRGPGASAQPEPVLGAPTKPPAPPKPGAQAPAKPAPGEQRPGT